MNSSIVDVVCEDIYKRHGALLPETVVIEAADTAHPLHYSFEWDNTVAGHKYRVEQASSMIRTVKLATVTPSGQCVQVRKYVNLQSEKRTTSYMPMEVVSADEKLKAELQKQYIKDLRAYTNRLMGIIEDEQLQNRAKELFGEIESIVVLTTGKEATMR